MKKILLSLLLPATLTASAQEGKFTVKGKIGNLNSPAKVYLRYAKDGNAVMDSAVLVNGKFKFKGEVTAPVRGSISVNHTGTGRAADALGIYLEKGTIKINAKDSAKNATVKGSKLNDDLQKMNLALKPVTDKSMLLNQEYAALKPEQRKDETIMAGINKKSEAIGKERKEIQKKFILENANSLIALDALNSYGGYSIDVPEIEPLFNSLSANVKTSKAGLDYAAKIEKARLTSVGAIAPEFTQNDQNGTPVSLKSFRGKYVLIDFWASWCGPCRAENPNVVKAYHAYKDKNFTVLGVSLDQPNAKEKWLKAVADDKLDWTQVSDLQYWKNAVAVQYGISAIPQNFLVGPDGKILAKNIRGEALMTTLEKIIDKKSVLK